VRLKVTGENPVESAVLSLGLAPEPLISASWGMMRSRILIAGVRLGVFDALAAGPKSSEEAARVLELDAQGLEGLFSALNGFGYLKRWRGRYSNTAAAAKWLVSTSPDSMADGIMFFVDLWDLLGDLEGSVRTGKTADLHHSGRPPEFWERYMRGLATFARFTGPAVAKKVRLAPPVERILDVAGGHGMYGAAICARHPGCVAHVLDLPEAIAIGRRIIDEAGMSDRVRFREGDLRAVDWGGPYDAVLLFNIVHNVSPEEARDMFARAREALRPKGTVVVMDSEYGTSEGDLSQAAGFGELMFYLTSGTRTYPEETIRSWMAYAGFTGLTATRLLVVPQAVIITGVR
jgi:hypothetical protein